MYEKYHGVRHLILTTDNDIILKTSGEVLPLSAEEQNVFVVLANTCGISVDNKGPVISKGCWERGVLLLCPSGHKNVDALVHAESKTR